MKKTLAAITILAKNGIMEVVAKFVIKKSLGKCVSPYHIRSAPPERAWRNWQTRQI